MVQLTAVITTIVWCGVGSIILYKVVDGSLVCALPLKPNAKVSTSLRTAKLLTTRLDIQSLQRRSNVSAAAERPVAVCRNMSRSLARTSGSGLFQCLRGPDVRHKSAGRRKLGWMVNRH